MPVTLSSTTNFSQTVVALVVKQLEDELRPTLPWLMPGNFRKASFVKGTNNTMRYLRYPDMAVTINGGTITPGTQPWLTEAVTPAAEALAFGFEEFSAYQAGRRIELSDIALERNPHDLISVAAGKVALNADQTADAYVGHIANLGTSVLYAANRVSRVTVAGGDVVTGQLIKKAVANMRADNIPTFADGTYHAIVHPGVVFDIESDVTVGGWVDAARYAGSMSLLSGELGMYAGVRFQQSTNAKVFTGAGAAGIDVYSTFIFGPEAYVFGDWGTITAHFVAPGGKGDELAQRASLGWKGNFGAMLIDEAGPRYLRIESASAL